jgi:serine/threonine-protein kinase
VLVLLLALVVAGLGIVVWKGISSGGGGGSTTTTGPVLVAVPDVSSLTPQAALDQLKADGFAPVLQGEYSTQPPNTVLGTDPKAGTQAAKGSPVKVLVSRGQKVVTVPDLKGEVWVNVRDTVTPNFKVTLQRQASDTVPRGQVIDTTPAANAQVPLGSPLTVILSTGPAQVRVPDESGKTRDDAVADLTGLGLQPTTRSQSSDTVDSGTVIGTDPSAGTSVAKGSSITVIVSSGSAPVPVPDVTGKSETDAQSQLVDLGLKVQTQDVAVTDPAQDGVVQKQSPDPGTKLKKGDTVTLQIGRLGGG